MGAILRNLGDLARTWLWVAVTITLMCSPWAADAIATGNLPMLLAIAFGSSFFIAVLLSPDDP